MVKQSALNRGHLKSVQTVQNMTNVHITLWSGHHHMDQLCGTYFFFLMLDTTSWNNIEYAFCQWSTLFGQSCGLWLLLVGHSVG